MKTKIRPHDFRVPPGEKVHLAKWPTIVKPVYDSKKEYEALLAKQVGSVLAAAPPLRIESVRGVHDFPGHGCGREGRCHPAGHVRREPTGLSVFSFKHPSATELEHDFLWRTTRSLPERGCIGIFDRSYYEEVGRPLVRRAGRRQGERAPDRLGHPSRRVLQAEDDLPKIHREAPARAAINTQATDRGGLAMRSADMSIPAACEQ